MDDYRPHLVVIDADRTAHVVPLSLLESVIRGDAPVTDMDELVVRAMLMDYLVMLQELREP